MKNITHYYSILCCLFALLVSGGCAKEYGNSLQGRSESQKEVEISISTGPNRATRAPLDGETTDPGDANENLISSLDLLIFGSDGDYIYRAEAMKISTDANGITTFRANLKETDETLTLHLLANCRARIVTWEAAVSDPTTVTADQILRSTYMVDDNPARLVDSDKFEPLPMYGTLSGVSISSSSSPTEWGPVNMLRSVASIDLYVAKTTATADFSLSELMVYFAPNKGYLASFKIPDTDPARYENPTMTTSLNAIEADGSNDGQMRASGIKTYTVDEQDYLGIAYQMYVYDNPWTTNTNDDNGRPTRLIVSGYYNGSEDKSYYPLDITYADGTYRPVIRNWKYEFQVTSVSGAGYPTLEEAAHGAMTDLNVRIIPWDKSGSIGVGNGGNYYAEMTGKEAVLECDSGSEQTLALYYTIDDGNFNMADDFSMLFMDDPQGEGGSTVSYDGFTVTASAVDDGDGNNKTGLINFVFVADQANTDTTDRTTTLTVYFRELIFKITIRQSGVVPNGWDNGGEMPIETEP